MGFNQKLVQTWSTVVLLYTTGQRDGWRHNVLHAVCCLSLSLISGSLLFLVLRLSSGLLVSGLVAGGSGLLMSVALFFSKGFRCFLLLFFISCAMKQGRNVLLATGAGLGMFISIRNIYMNLLEVSRSIECNLEKKKDLLEVSPLQNYIQMIKWVKEKLKMFSNLGIVKFEAQLKVYDTLDSSELRKKLEQAKADLKARVERAEEAFALMASVWKVVAPLLGTILLVVLVALFLKKFTRHKKYKNVYITRRFVEFDERQKALGKPHVLPLSKKESRRYIFIPSAKPSVKEAWPVAKFFIPVSTYILCWLLIMGLDTLLHWTISVISKQLMTLEPFRIPLRMTVRGMSTILSIPVSDSSSQRDFSFFMSLFESECAPQPSLMVSQSVAPLSAVISILVVLGLLTSKLLQVKLVVSEHFYSEHAEDRVKHLHDKILRERSKENARELERARFQSLRKDVKFWFPILDFWRGNKGLYSHQRK